MKMQSYNLSRLSWSLLGSILVIFCPLPFLMIALVILLCVVQFSPAVRSYFISRRRIALNFDVVMVPFLMLRVVSFLLDLLCDFVMTLDVPWTKIAIMESVGLAIVLCDLLSRRRTRQVFS